jgi:hypothetical protein
MSNTPDVVVCLANRRWSAFYDRSQHLMSHCARERTTVFVEEPELDTTGPDVELSETRTGVITLIPHLPPTLTVDATRRAQRRAIDFALAHLGCARPILWYYAPQAIAYTDHLDAAVTVYDWLEPEHVGDVPSLCLGRSHQRLLDRADVVFTDGEPDHRRLVHHNVHAFGVPTSVDGCAQLTWTDVWAAMWSRVQEASIQRGVLGSQLVAATYS